MPMTEKRILDAIKAYKVRMADYPPFRMRDDVKSPSWDRRCHLHWMCDQIPGFLKEGRREKVMRWLGFIQGTLWALDEYTIEEMKHHNMPTPEEKEAARLQEESERAEVERKMAVLRRMGEQAGELTQQALEESGLKTVDE